MKKSLLLMGAALALVVATPIGAQQTLNVRDADIRAFIQDAARVTGRTFIVDQRVQGKVSVVTDRPLSKSEYFEIFLSTLRANGLVAIPTTSGAYRIQPSDTAAAQPGRVGSGGAARNSFVTEIFRLRAIDAQSALETLRPLVSREGSVTANRAGNSLVVVDYADNIARVRQVLARIDRDNASTQVIPLQNSGAREIAQSLQQLLSGSSGGGGANGQPGGGAAATVVPIDSSNSIALRGDPSTVAQLAAVARDLDQRAESGTEIRVIYLNHADAGQLLPVLQQLIGQPVTPPTQDSGTNFTSSGLASMSGGSGSGSLGSGTSGIGESTMNTPSPTPTPVPTAAPAGDNGGGNSAVFLRGPVVVTRFAGANAVIIAGNSDTQRKLGQVVRQLDVARDQVLVEAIIVEISDLAAKRLGVQFLLAGDPDSGVPFLATNYSNAVPNILTLAGAYGAEQLNNTTTVINGETVTTSESSALGDSLQQAAASSILNATGGFGGGLVNIGSNAIFGAIINAVKSDTGSNILSTPHVMALDNHEASILVGQEIPITTGEALSPNFDNAFRTVQRENVGIQLDIKPQINAGGEIKLALRGEVSSIAGPVSSNSSELILNKREFDTTLTAQDGQILAIGGLLDENERKTIERIPLLSDIPLLGELFKSRTREKNKTNLMVFIRPTIIHDRNDGDALTAQRYGYMRGQQLRLDPDVEPSLDVLVREYMGTTPPTAPAPLPGDQVISEGAAVPVTGTAPVPGQPQVVRPQVRSSTSVVQPVPVPPSGQR